MTSKFHRVPAVQAASSFSFNCLSWSGNSCKLRQEIGIAVKGDVYLQKLTRALDNAPTHPVKIFAAFHSDPAMAREGLCRACFKLFESATIPESSVLHTGLSMSKFKYLVLHACAGA